MRSKLSAWILLCVLVGVTIGLGMYTFVYAKGYSYLTNDPKACMNCHVMADHYDGWIKSSHRSVAVCNDCHTPHNLFGKYTTKALNGFFHSLAFTSGRFPDNIEIKGRNARVTEGACRHCHAEITTSIVGAHSGKDISCVRCHFNVGHSAASFVMSDRSLSTPTGQNSPSNEGTSNGSR